MLRFITNDAPVNSTLTVSTSANTPGGTYTITVAGSDGTGKTPSNGTQALSLTTAAVIQHIVVMFQENRTPDNLFQDPVLIGRGADIASSGLNSTGQTIPLSSIDLGTTGSSPQNLIPCTSLCEETVTVYPIAVTEQKVLGRDSRR